mmetsp:Transcript_25421/g.74655  ORF Transcript_25421/g.74655 Transcript_25421/m.74655 type:complete len:230 (-) Transcript_25421:606-1295(-)
MVQLGLKLFATRTIDIFIGCRGGTRWHGMSARVVAMGKVQDIPRNLVVDAPEFLDARHLLAWIVECTFRDVADGDMEPLGYLIQALKVRHATNHAQKVVLSLDASGSSVIVALANGMRFSRVCSPLVLAGDAIGVLEYQLHPITNLVGQGRIRGHTLHECSNLPDAKLIDDDTHEFGMHVANASPTRVAHAGSPCDPLAVDLRPRLVIGGACLSFALHDAFFEAPHGLQ